MHLKSEMCKLHKPVFKKKILEALFAVLDTKEEYVEAPILLCKLKMNSYLKKIKINNLCLPSVVLKAQVLVGPSIKLQKETI